MENLRSIWRIQHSLLGGIVHLNLIMTDEVIDVMLSNFRVEFVIVIPIFEQNCSFTIVLFTKFDVAPLQPPIIMSEKIAPH